MTSYVATSSETASYVLYDGDRLFVPPAVYLTATNPVVLAATNASSNTVIAGSVLAGNSGFSVNAQPTIMVNATLQVLATGFLSGGDGAVFFFANKGTLTISNGGYIAAETAFGLATIFTSCALTTISNSGTIIGLGSIKALQTQSAMTRLTNSGTIESQNNEAIYFHNELQLVNTGNILTSGGVQNAIRARDGGTASIRNTGSIIGSISLSGGNDTFDNTGSVLGAVTLGDGSNTLYNDGLIEGAVSGGGGADVFTNSGVVKGAVSLGGQMNQLVNSGRIDGDVSFGSNADTLTNTGVITGNVDLGDGANIVVSAGAIQGSLTTGAGIDTIDLSYGRTTGTIVAGLGNDTITGGDQRDVIYGDDLASTAAGGGKDLINAGGGDDLVYGGYGVDTVTGGYGDDVLNGGYGADALYGNQGDDVLYGNQDNDWLHGGQGNDLLYAGQGNDTVNGGVGDDVLYGNLGDDQFVFSGPGFGHDTVADFSRASGNTDAISFGAGVFSSFADLQAHALQMPTGVLLYDAAGDTVFIVGATTGGLTAGMFVIG